MGTFELDCGGGNMHEPAPMLDAAGDCGGCGPADTRRMKQECIICAKVYDQCRHPDGFYYSKKCACGTFQAVDKSPIASFAREKAGCTGKKSGAPKVRFCEAKLLRVTY